MVAITFSQRGGGSQSGVTSYTVTYATAPTSGQLLIVALRRDGGATITVPSGWTQVAGPFDASLDAYVYAKIAGSSEPTTHTWSFSAATSVGHRHFAIDNFTGPINTYNLRIAGTYFASTSTPDPPSISLDNPPFGLFGDRFVGIGIAVWTSSGADVTGYPSGYSNGTRHLVAGANIASADLEPDQFSNHPVVNPSQFTLNAARQSLGITIAALRDDATPAPSGVTGTAAITEGQDVPDIDGEQSNSGTAGITEGQDVPDIDGELTAPPNNAFATIIEGQDVPSIDGSQTNSGLAGITEGQDVPSVDGEQTNSGFSGIFESPDVPSGGGEQTNSGASAAQEQQDSPNIVGGQENNGSSATTNANDTSSVIAEQVNSGTASAFEFADTSVGSGELTPPNLGSAVIAESADISWSFGDQVNGGFASASESPDTSSGVGVQENADATALTEGADTSSAIGEQVNSGSAGVLESPDIAVGFGVPTSSGTSSLVESPDSGVASGVLENSGSSAATEQSDASSSLGQQTNSGSGAASESADSASGVGLQVSGGFGAIIEGVDSASSSGSQVNGGSVSVIEGADSALSVGAVSNLGVAAIAESQDTASASGLQVSGGFAAIVEGTDLSAAAGDQSNAGSASAIESQDIAAGSGLQVSGGFAAIVEGDDQASSIGSQSNSGSASIVEQSDTAQASGIQVSGGFAAIIEGTDTASSVGGVSNTGSAAITEATDQSSASGTSLEDIFGSAAIVESPDSVSTVSSQTNSGSANLFEGNDTGSSAGGRERFRSGPQRCCCAPQGCPLGSDDFNRDDNDNPGPKWYEIDGDFDIVGSTIESITPGKLATRICHPSWATEGSWRADFDLVDLRTRSQFVIGAGNPESSSYRVIYEPLEMDTLNAKIRMTVVGDVTDTFDYAWLSDGFGNSVNTMRVHICFLPGVMIRGSVGQPPPVDVCAVNHGGPCFTVDGQRVGPFFYIDGRFDNWVYETLILDNFDCPPCACFCFRRAGPAKEFSCFPETLCLNFEVVDGYCPELDGNVIVLYQGEASPADGFPQKRQWFSEVQDCGGNQYTFILTCDVVSKDGNNWLYAPTLRMAAGDYISGPVLFNWIEPDTFGGLTRSADFDMSTCEPLSMVYPGLKVSSFVGPCPDTLPGNYLFCCPSVPCSRPAQYLELNLTVTLCAP
jgi:hypothetical protein